MILPLSPLPPAPSYLLYASVSVLVVGGATSQEQTASAANATGWALDRVAWSVTDSRPSGLVAPALAKVQGDWAAHPETEIDGGIQGGYMRETTYGIPAWGDLSKGWRLFWRRSVCVYPCPTPQDARDALAAVYSYGRPLAWGERDQIGGVWSSPDGWPAGDPRAALIPMRLAALRANAAWLPPLTTVAPPLLAPTPYDAADLLPPSVAAPVPYQSTP